MVGAAHASHGDAQLARLGLRQRHQLAQVGDAKVRARHQDQRRTGDQRDRREVLDGVERLLLEQRRIDGVAGVAQQQRAAIGVRLGHGNGRDIAGRAAPVLDDKGMPEPLLQLRRERARDDVGTAARRGADEDFRDGRRRARQTRGQDQRRRQQREEIASFHGCLRFYLCIFCGAMLAPRPWRAGWPAPMASAACPARRPGGARRRQTRRCARCRAGHRAPRPRGRR
ncbi:hypothetical protein D3C72_1053850 [compost metagenome]